MKCKTTALCLPLAALLGLGGCTLAPGYARPDAQVSAAWPSGPAYQEPSGNQSDRDVADLSWLEFFVDQRLQKLIALALGNNRDLRSSATRFLLTSTVQRISHHRLRPHAGSCRGAGQGLKF